MPSVTVSVRVSASDWVDILAAVAVHIFNSNCTLSHGDGLPLEIRLLAARRMRDLSCMLILICLAEGVVL
jgi:hypothetical protein